MEEDLPYTLAYEYVSFPFRNEIKRLEVPYPGLAIYSYSGGYGSGATSSYFVTAVRFKKIKNISRPIEMTTNKIISFDKTTMMCKIDKSRNIFFEVKNGKWFNDIDYLEFGKIGGSYTDPLR